MDDWEDGSDALSWSQEDGVDVHETGPQLDAAMSPSDSEELARSHYVRLPRTELRDRASSAMDGMDFNRRDQLKYAGRKVDRSQWLSGGDLGSDPDSEPATEDDGDDATVSVNSATRRSSLVKGRSKSTELWDGHDRVSDQSEESRYNELDAEWQALADQEAQVLDVDVSTHLKSSLKADIQKGHHIRHQLSLCDSLLDIRIRSQKLLQHANGIPAQPALMGFMLRNEGVRRALCQARSSLVQIIDKLLAVKVGLLRSSSLNPADTTALLKRHLDETPDEEALDATAKRAKIREAWRDMARLEHALDPLYRQTVDHWQHRVHLSNPKLNSAKKFKALNQSIVSQVDAAMQMDRERLLARTQVPRHPYRKGFGLDRKVLFFDDYDYYTAMLREVIQKRSNATADEIDSLRTTSEWARLREIQRENNPRKTSVDRRASKGRKIRYEVHPKLLNFMAPEPMHGAVCWNEERREQLFKSLSALHSK